MLEFAFEAPGIATMELREAERMTRSIWAFAHRPDAIRVGAEVPFEAVVEAVVKLDDRPRALSVRVGGKVDRIERRPDGVAIVDFKTGRSVLGRTKENPQLATYQLALLEGGFDPTAFDGDAPSPSELVQAELVYPRRPSRGRLWSTSVQSRLTDPDAFEQRIVDAALMAAGVPQQEPTRLGAPRYLVPVPGYRPAAARRSASELLTIPEVTW